MGHHIDDQGRFQSDRHPKLEPDKIVLSFKDMRARNALMALAEAYHDADPGLAEDIVARLGSLGSDSVRIDDDLEVIRDLVEQGYCTDDDDGGYYHPVLTREDREKLSQACLSLSRRLKALEAK